MLFFRDEEQVAAWCAANGTPVRPLVSLAQLWQLSVAWYSSRLTPDARRPGPQEMREIFGAIGLTGPFWDRRQITSRNHVSVRSLKSTCWCDLSKSACRCDLSRALVGAIF